SQKVGCSLLGLVADFGGDRMALAQAHREASLQRNGLQAFDSDTATGNVAAGSHDETLSVFVTPIQPYLISGWVPFLSSAICKQIYYVHLLILTLSVLPSSSSKRLLDLSFRDREGIFVANQRRLQMIEDKSIGC